jgi:hypothetical protein
LPSELECAFGDTVTPGDREVGQIELVCHSATGGALLESPTVIGRAEGASETVTVDMNSDVSILLDPMGHRGHLFIGRFVTIDCNQQEHRFIWC